MIMSMRLKHRNTINRIMPLADRGLPLSRAGLLPATRLVVLLRELLQQLDRSPFRSRLNELQPESHARRRSPTHRLGRLSPPASRQQRRPQSKSRISNIRASRPQDLLARKNNHSRLGTKLHAPSSRTTTNQRQIAQALVVPLDGTFTKTTENTFNLRLRMKEGAAARLESSTVDTFIAARPTMELVAVPSLKSLTALLCKPVVLLLTLLTRRRRRGARLTTLAIAATTGRPPLTLTRDRRTTTCRRRTRRRLTTWRRLTGLARSGRCADR
jgi:hypothetical protein